MEKNLSQKFSLSEKMSARVLLVVFLFCLVTFYGFLTVPIAYSKKILPKITVAGIDIGDKDYASAKQILSFESQKFQNIRLTLKLENKTFSPKLSQLGASVDIDKTIEAAILTSKSAKFSEKLARSYPMLVKSDYKEIPYEIAIDEQKFATYFRKLAKNIKQKPVNASLEIDNGNISYIEGKPGVTLDSEKIKNEVIASLRQGEIKPHILKTKKDAPYIQKPQTEKAKKQAEDWLDANVSVVVHYDPKAEKTQADKTFTLSRSEIGSFITFKDGFSVLEADLSLDPVSKWAQDVASDSEILPDNNKIQITNEKRKLLSKGKEGQAINPEGLPAKIISAIKDGKGTIKIKAKKTPPQDELIGGVLPGRFKGKYIEVVLSQQKMYVFNGKKLINTYLVSTGKYGMATPTGTFKILAKTTWAKCKPSPEYKTCFMPYSMFFTGLGHAIHELPMIDGMREGDWHLGIPVSHGCIRLGVGAAEYMYNWTPVGTPLIVHY